MRKVVDNLTEIATARIRNPFTGTFITSWIVFNWKGIAYFIFSKEEISTKISHIQESYSSINEVLYYPLLSTIVFLFVVPYINSGNEWFIKKSKIDRDKRVHDEELSKLRRETVIAEKQVEKEIAVETVRKKTNHNLEIANLQKKIVELEETVKLERQAREQREQEINEVSTNMLRTMEKTYSENNRLKAKLVTAYGPSVESDLTMAEYNNVRNPQLRNFISERKRFSRPQLLKNKDRVILQIIDIEENLIFYDIRQRIVIPIAEAAHLLTEQEFEIVSDIEDILSAYNLALGDGVKLKPLRKAELQML